MFSRGYLLIIAPIQTSFVDTLFLVPGVFQAYADEER